nr:UPF0481 protein At3g47200-like [Ipomoea trifida]
MALSSGNEIPAGEESGLMLVPQERPYHHGKPELQPLERLKPKVFDYLISDGNLYRKKVLEVVDEARSCYDEGSTDEFDDSQFAEIMLLDSCFLLCYMIPLWIVEFLYNDIFMGISWKLQLVGHCQRNLYGGEYTVDNDDKDRDAKPLHLLQAFHTLMVCKSHTTPIQEVTPSTHSSIGRCCPNFMRAHKNSTTIKEQKDSFEKYGYVFRSVMDLKAKGIHFGHSDNIYSVTSITFDSSNYAYAKLKLPIWYASPLSKVFFSNMLAYEICSNDIISLEITAYVNFMKSLIVCPNDVKELREKRIISNTLGDDMEVVQLFKGLNTHGIDDPEIFREVKQKIQQHYDSKANTWMAELVYTHLRSPWTIIALLAASLLLLLTMAQTYAAFNPRN